MYGTDENIAVAVGCKLVTGVIYGNDRTLKLVTAENRLKAIEGSFLASPSDMNREDKLNIIRLYIEGKTIGVITVVLRQLQFNLSSNFKRLYRKWCGIRLYTRCQNQLPSCLRLRDLCSSLFS